jgi:hypothetical protein
MIHSIEGVFRNGKIELLQEPPDGADGRVIVTFLSTAGSIDLRRHGVSTAQARDLKARLNTFAEDWSRPEMDVYDAV